MLEHFKNIVFQNAYGKVLTLWSSKCAPHLESSTLRGWFTKCSIGSFVIHLLVPWKHYTLGLSWSKWGTKDWGRGVSHLWVLPLSISVFSFHWDEFLHHMLPHYTVLPKHVTSKTLWSHLKLWTRIKCPCDKRCMTWRWSAWWKPKRRLRNLASLKLVLLWEQTWPYVLHEFSETVNWRKRNDYLFFLFFSQ